MPENFRRRGYSGFVKGLLWAEISPDRLCSFGNDGTNFKSSHFYPSLPRFRVDTGFDAAETGRTFGKDSIARRPDFV
jgi:hypothetical protein